MAETEVREGPQKGQMGSSTFSDYQEVGGLYFPFSISMQGQAIAIKDIILNPEVDAALFTFPEPKAEVGKE